MSNLFETGVQDLARSSLTPEDMSIRTAQSVEYAALGMPSREDSGYVIPYFNILGKPIPFYRVRIFNAKVKYRQPKNTSNTIYFPKDFQACLKAQKSLEPYVVLCEGEKKAATAVKMGIPAVALGGVDSWKNRTFIIPEGSDLAKSYNAKDINLKIPSGAGDIAESGLTTLASGFMELVDFAIQKRLKIVICYDSDTTVSGSGVEVKFEVQRAAASLAYELRYRGVPFGNILQLILPEIPGTNKVGLDDYLVSQGGESLIKLLHGVINPKGRATGFPTHPNIREYVNRKLQKTKLTRKESQNIAMAILSDLDANGGRLRSEDEGQMYYFDYTNNGLVKASMNVGGKGLLHETDFGKLLYKRYGLSAADGRVLTWLDAQFNAEEPIENVTPHRIIARPGPNEDVVRYQINDGQYVKIGKDIEIFDNGHDGFLFESGKVDPLSAADLMKEIEKQRHRPLKPWWTDVLDTVRLKKDDKNKDIISLLYYISPWLYKWRGAQLPVELVIGESGSGKSSLCEHRLNIITGSPKLRNAPSDLKDWHASITNSGGLHVTDNVNLVDKNLRQRLSDEICRLITEPDPHIEMRKLYSNNELISIPARITFALTAIQQPFQQADLLQRAFIVELDKTPKPVNGNAVNMSASTTYEQSWVSDQMVNFGGRAAWLAHHVIVLQAYFAAVEKFWNPRYAAKHRLINLEQSLMVMAQVFDQEFEWIPNFIHKTSNRSISEADWALEGLKAFAEMWIQLKGKNSPDPKAAFTAAHVSEWCKMNEDFEECYQLTNTRSLGRYMKSHGQLILDLAGISKGHKANNKQTYRV